MTTAQRKACPPSTPFAGGCPLWVAASPCTSTGASRTVVMAATVATARPPRRCPFPVVAAASTPSRRRDTRRSGRRQRCSTDGTASGPHPARCAAASLTAATANRAKPTAHNAFCPAGLRNSERSKRNANAAASSAAAIGGTASATAGTSVPRREDTAVTGSPGATTCRYAKSRPPNIPSWLAAKT